jgi:hypothetical protein
MEAPEWPVWYAKATNDAVDLIYRAPGENAPRRALGVNFNPFELARRMRTR